MHISRDIFNIETATRKLFSRFRGPLQISRVEWPVISIIRPLFYLIRLFGLAPFQISEDDFIPGNYNVIYSLFCTIVQSYCAYLVISRFASIKRGRPMIDVTETGKVVFNYIVAVLNILIAVRTRKEFIRVLKIVKNFDLRIHDLGYPRTESRMKLWVWSTCVFTILLWITISRLGLLAFAESWTNNVTYLINYLATSLSIVKFSSVVLLLGQRFRSLNKLARYSKESIKTTKEFYFAIDLKVIQRLHNSLMNASESLNSQYEWLLFLWVINLSMHSVSNMYLLIDWLLVTPADWATSQVAFLICVILWLVAFVGQLLLLHMSCQFTSTEANSIGSIVFNWVTLNNSRYYKLQSSLHFFNRKLNFSAAGCFYVNVQVLRSIAAILTTYLILLMQFSA